MALLPLPIPTWRVVGGIKALFARPERLDDPWYWAAADEFVRGLQFGARTHRVLRGGEEIYLEEPWGQTGFWDRLPALSVPTLFVCGGSATAWSRRRSHVTWTACSPPPPRSYWATAGTSRSSSFPNVRTTWCVSSSKLRKHPRKPLHGI
jgi:hypothetical protein